VNLLHGLYDLIIAKSGFSLEKDAQNEEALAEMKAWLISR
jgi:hypothetical protein